VEVLLLKIYLGISGLLFLIVVLANRNIFKEEVLFFMDHLDQDLWGSDLWESKVYIAFASLGAIIGILAVFAIRSLVWWYWISMFLKQAFVKRMR